MAATLAYLQLLLVFSVLCCREAHRQWTHLKSHFCVLISLSGLVCLLHSDKGFRTLRGKMFTCYPRSRRMLGGYSVMGCGLSLSELFLKPLWRWTHLNLNLFGSSLFCGSVACCIHQVLTANSLKTFFVKSASLVPALVFLDVTLLEAALSALTCCVCWTHKDLWWEQGLAGLLSLALWSLNNNTGGLSWRPVGICPHQGPACVFMEQISKCCWVLGKYPVWPISAGGSIANLRSSSTECDP